MGLQTMSQMLLLLPVKDQVKQNLRVYPTWTMRRLQLYILDTRTTKTKAGEVAQSQNGACPRLRRVEPWLTADLALHAILEGYCHNTGCPHCSIYFDLMCVI